MTESHRPIYYVDFGDCQALSLVAIDDFRRQALSLVASFYSFMSRSRIDKR